MLTPLHPLPSHYCNPTRGVGTNPVATSSSRNRTSGVWRLRVGSVHSAPRRETPYGVLGMECRMELSACLLSPYVIRLMYRCMYRAMYCRVCGCRNDIRCCVKFGFIPQSHCKSIARNCLNSSCSMPETAIYRHRPSNHNVCLVYGVESGCHMVYRCYIYRIKRHKNRKPQPHPIAQVASFIICHKHMVLLDYCFEVNSGSRSVLKPRDRVVNTLNAVVVG